MSDDTGIEWTDATWEPDPRLLACIRGCRHRYAERVAARFSGRASRTRGWCASAPPATDRLERHGAHGPRAPADPLRWRRPRRVFVNSMSDLFHESLPDS